MTAKLVAQSAGRALGLLIAKFKSLGGMPFDVYSKLYDSLVWPVIAYGAALWGGGGGVELSRALTQCKIEQCDSISLSEGIHLPQLLQVIWVGNPQL